MFAPPALVLASASPRRAELLAAAGLAFVQVPADVDESIRAGEAPDAYVERLAEVKARAIAARFPTAVVLGADTVVVLESEVLGKPRDDEDAVRMLTCLQGRAHDVITGVALVSGHRLRRAVARTTVWMAPVSPEEITRYVATGEPMDKAGAYAVQGIASRYVTRLDGSYSNVVGLPVALVYRLLQEIATDGG